MSAEFGIYKYTGKECTFGTPVSSIGIKRIDAAVPAVYGVPIVPSDDKTDVNTYAIYRPDTIDDDAYSFESIFKLVLKTPPSNQLSHVRIYPTTERPDDPNIPILKIGCSSSFSRPTNTQSLVATNDIWNYTEESPFLVTVGGNVGQSIDEQVAVVNYNITQNDIGFGNLMYLNEERQLNISIVEKLPPFGSLDTTPVVDPANPPYTFVDKTNGAMTFQIFDVNTDLPIIDDDIVVTTNGVNERVVTLNPTNALLTSYPNGFKYGDISNVGFGGTIAWLDLTSDPIERVIYDVTVETLSNGSKAFFLNGVRNPVLNFRENRIYQFNNPYGVTDPIRFLTDSTLTQSNVEDKIIIKGITVADGGTENEIVTVNPSDIKIAGQVAKGYQSSFHPCYGNVINNTNTALIGNYNINTVGAGVSNSLAAGETDFIYVQLAVTGNSTIGQTIPELKIEYDEN